MILQISGGASFDKLTIKPVITIATIAFQTSAVSADNLTTYTFASQAIGTASATRKIIVGVGGQNVGGQGINTVTVGGNSAAQIAATGVFNSENRAEIWAVDVASGTTADVVVTWADAAVNCGIGIWAADDTAASVSDTLTDITNPLNGTIDVPANGWAVGYMYSNGGPSTWTGIDEDFDDTGLDAREQSGASKAFTTIQTGLTVSISVTSPLIDGMAVVSYGPL